MENVQKSGYRPRHGESRFNIQQKMKELNADFDDNGANKVW